MLKQANIYNMQDSVPIGSGLWTRGLDKYVTSEIKINSVNRSESVGLWLIKALLCLLRNNPTLEPISWWPLVSRITFFVSRASSCQRPPKRAVLFLHWLSYLVCCCTVSELCCAGYSSHTHAHIHTQSFFSCPCLRVWFDSCPLSKFEWVSKK